MKSNQFYSGDQYFSPTNNFTRLKLTATKNFYRLFFLLNKNHITEIFKKNYQIYYTIIWLSGVGYGRVVKKGKFTAADQSKLDSSGKEEELHVDVIFDGQIDLAINFLFLK